MLRTMFLFEDRLPAGTKPVYLPRENRAIYVASGGVDIHSDNTIRYVSEGSALVAEEELTLSATEVDSTVWRWELARDASDETAHTLRSAPQTSSELKLTATFELDDRYTWLMRCDTVTFPPGGIAWTHLHQGPGIRITRSGEITIETEGATQVHGPGAAWAEKGFCRYTHRPPSRAGRPSSDASYCRNRIWARARSVLSIPKTTRRSIPRSTESSWKE